MATNMIFSSFGSFLAIGNLSSPQSGSLWVKIELCRPFEGELEPRGLWQLSWIMFGKFVNYMGLGGSSYSDECYIMSNVCHHYLSNDSSSHLICWTWLINLETSLGPFFFNWRMQLLHPYREPVNSPSTTWRWYMVFLLHEHHINNVWVS